MSELTGNLLVLQTGLPTAVGNSILAGVIEQALSDEDGAFNEIYGAKDGIIGLQAGSLIDLGGQNHKTIEGLRRTPGSALGTSSGNLSRSEAEAALEVLKTQGVKYVVAIGGAETVEVARTLETVARSQGQSLNVIAVPQSSTNELAEGDHAPGFGSAARWIACAARELAFDAAARKHEKPVVVLQVSGTTGWLAAAAGIGLEGAPGGHLTYVPERATTVDEALENIKATVEQSGSCVVVVTEHSLTNEDGKHPCAGGLAAAVKEKLGLSAGASLPGGVQRFAPGAVKATDADEAFSVGQMASRLVKEMSGFAVILRREAGASYKATPGTTQLETFAVAPRPLPADYLNEAGTGVTVAFLDYVRPLLGGALTEYVALTETVV